MDWQSIDGWFSQADAKFVSNILLSIKNGMVIEIGCFKGRSTAVMMPIAIKNRNKYYVIDNFYGGIDENTAASKVQRAEGPKVMEIFVDNIEQIGIHRSEYALYKSTSEKASTLFKDDSIDFCFIDGDHAYESVKKDLELYWPKIKKDGIISGHDYQNAEIKKAVDEMNLKVCTGGNCWSIKK